MQLSLMIIFSLLGFGNTRETFNYFQGKSLQQTSYQFEMMDPVSSRSHRHCTMLCHHRSKCLAAEFEGELNLCRLYSNINGTTTGKEGDFAMVKDKFGICKSLFLCLIPVFHSFHTNGRSDISAIVVDICL